MFYLEAHKFFKRKLILVLLIGFFVLVAVSTIGNALYLMSDYEKMQRKADIYEKYNGTFTESVAEKFLMDYKEILSDEGIEELSYESEHLKILADTLPDIGFDITFGFYEEWQMLLTDLIIYIQYIPVFVAVTFSGIFTYDKSYGMQEIMLSSKNGRKKCTKAKVLLAFLVTNGMFFLVAFVTFLKLFLLTRGKGWNTSIQMAAWLRDSPLEMNFGSLWLHTLFLSFIAVNGILLITLSVSFLAKNPVAAMCISLGVLFVLRPDVVRAFAGNVETAAKIVSLSPYNIIDTYSLARLSPMSFGGSRVQWIYIVEIVYVVLLTAGGIFFFKRLIKNYKYFAS